MKSSVYPAVIVVALLGLVGFVLASQFSVTIEQVEPETPLVTTPAPRATATPIQKPTKPASVARVPRGLRISNQTDQPVRVALLARNSSTADRKPAHWDFAPQEGSAQGLILSLPEGNLKLNKGDVLVGFAQDGSGQYWGPYVVGETPAPVWNKQTQEWELTLK